MYFTETFKIARYNHFVLNDDGTKYECVVPVVKKEKEGPCGALISAWTGDGPQAPSRGASLLRHLQRFHPSTASEVAEKEADGQPLNKKSKTNQKPITSFFVPVVKTVTIKITKEEFEDGLVDMVARGGASLSFFSTPGYQKTGGQLAAALNVSLDRQSVRNLVIRTATTRKQELIQDLRGQFVFLKTDACTRHRRNYLGVNVQFCKNGKVCTSTVYINIYTTIQGLLSGKFTTAPYSKPCHYYKHLYMCIYT